MYMYINRFLAVVLGIIEVLTLVSLNNHSFNKGKQDTTLYPTVTPSKWWSYTYMMMVYPLYLLRARGSP